MNVLLVEDDEDLAIGLARVLGKAGHTVTIAADGRRGLALAAGSDVVVSDLRLGDLDGLDVLREVRQRHPGVEVLMMTGYATIASAVEAMRRGARGYLAKPFDPEELVLRLREVEEILALRQSSTGRGGLVGSSAAMRRVFQRIDVAAGSDAPVLILGETGSGKELAAQAVHRFSDRRNGAFIAVNCGAIPRELVESELFGHEAGAFTGAVGRREGRFLLARGGVLFLDEVNSLPLDTQPKLLRALESHEIWMVGSREPIECDARILAASNVDLESEVKAGRFREDLYWRLNVLRIEMPPLRAHGEDIPAIVASLLNRAATPERDFEISADALAALLPRPWPGNVRELGNLLKRACAHAVATAGPEAKHLLIQPEHLDLPLEVSADLPFKQARERAAEEWSRRTIRSALMRSGGNASQAAKLLRMNRTALLRLMKKLGVVGA